MLTWIIVAALFTLSACIVSEFSRRRERRLYQRLLQQTRLAVNASGEGMIGINEEGMISFVNDAALGILDYGRDALTGKPAHLVLHQNWSQGEQHPLEECPFVVCQRENRSIVIDNTAAYRRDGSTVPTKIIASPIRFDKKVIGAVVNFHDISQQLAFEEAKDRYTRDLEQANSFKQVFNDILRHDLLGPISNIRVFLGFLTDRDDLAVDGRAHLDRISANMERVCNIIEECNSLSQLESTEKLTFQHVDLAAVVREVIGILEETSREKGVELIGDFPDTMPLNANPIIGQLVDNLVANALKYAPEGKRVIVKGTDSNSSWLLKVIDFGAGVPDIHKEQIFARFTRLEKGGVKGVGLGLAICKRVAKLHDGRIWVEDNPEGGAVFCCEIPKGG